jgi:hypothetical protein
VCSIKSNIKDLRSGSYEVGCNRIRRVEHILAQLEGKSKTHTGPIYRPFRPSVGKLTNLIMSLLQLLQQLF